MQLIERYHLPLPSGLRLARPVFVAVRPGRASLAATAGSPSSTSSPRSCPPIQISSSASSRKKLGLLRVYFEPSLLPSDEIEEATDAALAEAVAESRITCERCGKPAEQHSVRGTGRFKCEACAAEEARRKKVLLPSWVRRLLAPPEEDRLRPIRAPRRLGRAEPARPVAGARAALLEKYPVLYREAWVAPKNRRADSPAAVLKSATGGSTSSTASRRGWPRTRPSTSSRSKKNTAG